MKKTLILGYGNPDRQDDGVAWIIVQNVASKLRINSPSLEFPMVSVEEKRLTLALALQLLPEMAELVAQHDRVLFVDAHTGRVPDDLSVEKLDAQYQNSPFTHHLTPQTCLSLSKSIYSKTPEAVLISVRGYQFDFQKELSLRTRALADQAVERILTWL